MVHLSGRHDSGLEPEVRYLIPTAAINQGLVRTEAPHACEPSATFAPPLSPDKKGERPLSAWLGIGSNLLARGRRRGNPSEIAGELRSGWATDGGLESLRACVGHHGNAGFKPGPWNALARSTG
jgi:hypothetical protein